MGTARIISVRLSNAAWTTLRDRMGIAAATAIVMVPTNRPEVSVRPALVRRRMARRTINHHSHVLNGAITMAPRSQKVTVVTSAMAAVPLGLPYLLLETVRAANPPMKVRFRTMRRPRLLRSLPRRKRLRLLQRPSSILPTLPYSIEQAGIIAGLFVFGLQGDD
jgi:hypothetical protein